MIFLSLLLPRTPLLPSFQSALSHSASRAGLGGEDEERYLDGDLIRERHRRPQADRLRDPRGVSAVGALQGNTRF